MIVVVRRKRKPWTFIALVRAIFGKPASPTLVATGEPTGAVGLLRPMRLDVDLCCLVSLATVIGLGAHEGLLTMNQVRCLGEFMNAVLVRLDRPTQEAIAAGDRRGRQLIADYVRVRLFEAAGSSPSNS